MDILKKPLFIAVLVAGACAALGSLLGWFSIGNETVRSIAETELAKKENLLLVITIISLLVISVIATAKKHRLIFIVIPISLFGLAMTINQKPAADVAARIDLIVDPGYWLSIIGTLAVMVTSAIIGIKGFDPFHKESK